MHSDRLKLNSLVKALNKFIPLQEKLESGWGCDGDKFNVAYKKLKQEWKQAKKGTL